jgi:hypothetical protein
VTFLQQLRLQLHRVQPHIPRLLLDRDAGAR